MTSRESLPAEMGYRWPAEWEPHVATWLSWPHKQASWPDAFEPVPPLFARFVQTLAPFEPVEVLAGGADVLAEARRHLGDTPHVRIHDIPTDDAWCRDHGPMFLTSATGLPPALVDWKYNAWGGKYPPFDQDDAVPRRVAETLGFRRFDPGIILEGGAVDGNGLGTVLTTTRCLLNPNRNKHLSKADVERYLAGYLGVRNVLWLDGGDLAGDDTDGHVDQLARFVGPRTVVVASEENRADANFEPLALNYRQLQEMRDQDGLPLEVVKLPLPSPCYHQGDPSLRMPASYCNFHLANGVAVVPVFGDPHDERALETLGRLLPDRRIIGIPAVDMIWGLGAFHCLSQQQPRWDLPDPRTVS